MQNLNAGIIGGQTFPPTGLKLKVRRGMPFLPGKQTVF